jgi:aminoglycoside 6'-N-acetyltransferase I
LEEPVTSTESSFVNIELKLSDAADAHIIQNLWPLYQHDVSEFEKSLVSNRHGLFGVDDSVKTLANLSDQQDPWWRNPKSLFPYIALVDGRPAGFNLVAAQPRLPVGIEADFIVHEFFVLHAYRGKGVGERAAIQGFDRHRGKWEIVTWPSHGRAVAFWRRVLSSYASNGHSEEEIDHPWGRRIAFRLDNAGGSI